jgi:hypothetical protein
MSKVFIGYLSNANSTSSDHTPRKLTAPASLVEVGYFFADFCLFSGLAINITIDRLGERLIC